MKKMLIALMAVGCATVMFGGALLTLPLDKDGDLKKLIAQHKLITLDSTDASMQVVSDDTITEKGSIGASYKLNVADIAGKTVLFSCEAKRDIGKPASTWQGGKFMITYQAGGKTNWPGVYMKPGKTQWEKIQFKVDFPQDTTSAILTLGIQAAKGKINFRNLKIEVLNK